MARDAYEQPSDATGPAERTLRSLRSFAHLAFEQCRKPLTDAPGSARQRWEIYSTWILLICLQHAETEAERCKHLGSSLYRTEAQAVTHAVLNHRSARALAAVLRWLRWVHRWAPSADEEAVAATTDDMDEVIGDRADYERTRCSMQMRSALPAPLEPASAFHPDGPLHQRDRFHDADLEDERCLLRRLWTFLRRGEIPGAFAFCESHGQAWRAAILQGMLPYDDGAEEGVGYSIPMRDEDGDEDGEDELAMLKEEHTDWVETNVTTNGNPWRRLWKEQCWDTAERHVRRHNGNMDSYEVAMYGYCAGHIEALLPVCEATWTDRCWGELHCLKESLFERLLDANHEQWCEDKTMFPGQGDGGQPDEAGDTQEARASRSAKLSGKLRDTPLNEVETYIAAEVARVLARIRSDPLPRLRSGAVAPFAELQATIILSAWKPEQSEIALGILRRWLADGIDGQQCPYLVKEFASHFSMWQKEVLPYMHVASACALGIDVSMQDVPSAPNVDDLVCEHVQELVATVATSGLEHCISGQAIELIAEHLSALTVECRLESFTDLVLDLCKCAHGESDDHAPSSAKDRDVEILAPKLLARCMTVFWDRYPQEAFPLLAILVRRALRLGGAPTPEQQLPEVGLTGVRATVQPSEVGIALGGIVAFWSVMRDIGTAPIITDAFDGLELLFGAPPQGSLPRTIEEFASLTLSLAVAPLLTDTLFSFAVCDQTQAIAALAELRNSLLWKDVFNARCNVEISEHLDELKWYLGLMERHSQWFKLQAQLQQQRLHGLREPLIERVNEIGSSHNGERGVDDDLKLRCGESRSALLEWARERLRRDKSFLEARPGVHTMLPNDLWENLRRTCAFRATRALLSVFEATGDFDGAMNDLAVLVAESPWLLKLLRPEHSQDFLRRIALIPSSLERLHTAGTVAT